MATWHQKQNKDFIKLYAPAEIYQKKTGGFLIEPENNN